MRVAIFDGILETHVASSLERAFLARGHSVLNTGKFGRGFEFVKDPELLSTITSQIDRVSDFQPDLIFVFRPASLPVPFLQRLKKTGAQLMAWLSDDPVLWKLSYGPVLDYYDHILHCGSARVLEFYEARHGRPTGINFPFWTDSEAFPYVYGTQRAESDALFLGNVHDQVRRQRYFDLAKLDVSVRVHGNAGQDYYNIWGGYLDSDSEVLDAGSRAKLAINIPQFFKDHRGLPTWFDGLDELGFFQYPSRVIQYAAMGLPIISVVPNSEDATSFPEMKCVQTVTEIDNAAKEMLNGDLLDLSIATHKRFLSHYSARSRVLAIEALLKDESWKSVSALERANWFTNFDGSGESFEHVTDASSMTREPQIVVSQQCESSETRIQTSDDLKVLWRSKLDFKPQVSQKTILLIGTGWVSEVSQLMTIHRALQKVGHRVISVNPFNYKEFITKDPVGEFRGVIDLQRLLTKKHRDVDAVLFIGSTYIPSVASRTFADSRGISLINMSNDAAKYTAKVGRLAGLMDMTSFVNPLCLENMRINGLSNIRHDPELFDLEFVRELLNTDDIFEGVTVLAQKSRHISKNRALLTEFHPFAHREYVAEDLKDSGLRDLAQQLRSVMTFILPDTGRPGPLANPYVGHALVAGSLAIVPRAIDASVNIGHGTHAVAFNRLGELHMKLARLADSNTMYENLISKAVEFGFDNFSAEHVLMEIFDDSMNPQVHSGVAETITTVRKRAFRPSLLKKLIRKIYRKIMRILTKLRKAIF